ncbi:MAG: NADH-quinone oxidoreductase subunit D [Ectothiorhodospiraceae bacterium]|nr:NADH-quinone oxidoreductase subunit D [Ectothiorhodospiraceae bacterium]
MKTVGIEAEYNQPISTSDLPPKEKQPQILRALLEQDPYLKFEDPLEHDMVLNMGPSHPATHGVLRLLVRLDGETVISVVPEVGYLHRGYEKIAENETYHEFITHTDRLDYLQPLHNNVAYILAVEKLLGLEVPPRAQYLRTLISELARISSHLVAMGVMTMDVGAMTLLLWCFREREKLYDIFDLIAGARFTTSYTRIGGLAQDISDESIAAVKAFIDQFPDRLEEAERLINRNRIFFDRCRGVGVISKEDALAWGFTGPNLRGSGVDHDLRKDRPYLVYDQMDFDVPIETEGDALARYYVRLAELRESIKIVQQCLEKMPKGPIHADDPKKVLPRKEEVYTRMEELIHDFMIVNFGVNPPAGEVYHAVESSKGHLGFYIVSKEGEGHPWRLKIRSPSFCNIQVLPKLIKGHLLSDIVTIIGSIDPVLGEADK